MLNPGRLLAAASILMVALPLAALAGTVYFARGGLDLLDEAYYVVSIADPWRFPGSATQFGFVYHPIYAAVDGNLAWLRRVNIVLTSALVCIAARQVLRALTTLPPRVTTVLSATFAGLGLLSVIGYTTPSYNSLIAQCGAAGILGLALSSSERARAQWAGSALAGAALWGVALAKPPAAVAFALLVGAMLVLGGQLTRRRVAGIAAGGLATALLSATMIAGSPLGFARRLRLGASDVALSGDHAWSAVLRPTVPDPSASQALAALCMAVFLIAALAAVSQVSRRVRHTGLVVAAASLLLFGVVCVLRPTVVDGRFDGRVVVVLAALAAAFGAAMLHRQLDRPVLDRAQRAWIGFLLLTPLTLAVGTNTEPWRNAASMSAWWFLAAVIVISAAPQASTQRAAVVGTSAAIIGTAFVVGQWAFPYDQPGPLWENTVRTSFTGHTHLLTAGQARVVGDTRRAGAEFAPGTGLIDLSGVSPGAAPVLGGVPIDQPWAVALGSGSTSLEVRALRRQSCQTVSSAWVVVSDGVWVSVDRTRVLRSFGAGEGDYEVAGSWRPYLPLWMTAASPERLDALLASSHVLDPARQAQVSLWKPSRTPDAAEAACRRVRGTGR